MAGNRTQCSLRPRLKFLARLPNFTSGLEGKITKFSKTYILQQKKMRKHLQLREGREGCWRVVQTNANESLSSLISRRVILGLL